ncbi:MAG TPA: response regulator transcription factor [Afifellaceae bacterium]|nr:response regulator transcription factor [Afifellaceae bacterium]
MSDSILLIEDDPRLAEMVSGYLGEAGFHVSRASTATQGLSMHQRGQYQAIVLDLMLPDGDGLDVCRQIRAKSGTPILILTARGDTMDRVIGLEMGADDYLPKPFEPRELLARLRAILRRGHMENRNELMVFGDLEIDRGARTVRVGEKVCDLTSYQFELLTTLAEHAGRVMSREQLMDLMKGQDLEAFDRSIDVQISRIRAMIEEDSKHPRRIITVRGAGYVFAKAQG